jgi:C4-dicarboxylate transporter, DctM subunit
MGRVEIGIIGVVVALVLIGLRMPIGVVLGVVSFLGTAWLIGFDGAWGLLTSIPLNFVANWNLSAVPMFLLMGFIAARAGLTNGLFTSARVFVGRIPGSLASSTVMASALFAACSGSSMATAAAFARISVPEMLKAGYRPSLATGAVAAAGTLGSLIPPSILMIIYGIFTNTSIADLFMAGVLPGLLSAAAYIIMITTRATLDPTLAPVTEHAHTRKEIWAALRDIWPLPALVVGVLGGIFAGVFTPTEAGAVGAALAMVIAVVRRTLSRETIKKALIETAEGTSTVFIIVIGAVMFSTFMGLTSLPTQLAAQLLTMVDSPLTVIFVISVLFIILGCFIESTSIMLLTLPIIQPVLQGLGVDMVWFGIIVIKLLEIGMITPPVGMCCFVIRSALGSRVSLSDVFRGATWFVATDLVTLSLIVAFPMVALYLPQLMK